MFERILTLVVASHLKVISPRPLRLAFHLIPAVKDFAYFYEPFLLPEPARRFVGFRAGVAFHLNRDQDHPLLA